MNTEKASAELTEILKNITDGRVSVALAGSRAKQVDDEDSDLDLYMLVGTCKPYDEVYTIVSRAADANTYIYISTAVDSKPYGGAINFTYQGAVRVHALQSLFKYFYLYFNRM